MSADMFQLQDLRLGGNSVGDEAARERACAAAVALSPACAPAQKVAQVVHAEAIHSLIKPTQPSALQEQLHAQALSRSTGPSAMRAVGMGTAWGVVAIGGIILLAQSLRLV